jgi:diguanylate cyclase (GGDEF)-like protein
LANLFARRLGNAKIRTQGRLKINLLFCSFMTVSRLLCCLIMLICPFLAAALWFCTPVHRRAQIKRWSAAIAIGATAFLMFALIGIAPDWFTLPLGNAALTATLMLCVIAILNFEKDTVANGWWIPPTVATAVIVFALVPNPRLRSATEAMWFCIAMLGSSYVVWRRARGSTLPSYWLIIAGGIGTSAVMFARSIYDWTTPLARANDDWHTTFTFAGAYLMGTSWTIGYIMLQRDRAEVQLHEMAMTDPLTGIHNRRMFFELAEAEFRRAKRTGTAMTLLMIDIDHFKIVNDTHGHVVGDQVLRHVADTIGKCLRNEDVFVRYGGEEFGVMMVNVSEEIVRQLSERIRLAVEHAPYLSASGKTITLSVSVGVCRAVPSATNSLEHLLAHADASVYQAKREGRNRVVLHSVTT